MKILLSKHYIYIKESVICNIFFISDQHPTHQVVPAATPSAKKLFRRRLSTTRRLRLRRNSAVLLFDWREL